MTRRPWPRWYDALIPQLQMAILVTSVVLVATTVAGGAIAWTTAQHERRAARLAVCAAELRALKIANPFVEKFLTPVDACAALQVVRGGDR